MSRGRFGAHVPLAALAAAALMWQGCASRAPTKSGRELSREVERDVPAPSLAGNLLGDEGPRRIAVYLPASYHAGTARYPTIYFLGGFQAGVYSYPFIPGALDETAARGDAREMIGVVVSGRNALGGSFYVSSPVTGAWEDYVVRDVVGFVDSHYRTIPKGTARGIAGHAMGGFGALAIAMRHPDVFGSVYAMSPLLFDDRGLADSQIFATALAIDSFLATEAALSALPPERARKRLLALSTGDDLTYAYGAAFSPDPSHPALFDYPYHAENGERIRDESVWTRWQDGLGGIRDKVQRYRIGLLRLRAICVEYGRNDENRWIPRGCRFLSRELTAAGIPHTLVDFDGYHRDQLPRRIRDFMVPFFAKHLDFSR